MLTGCSERQREIDDWGNREKRGVEDDFIDGKTTLLRAGVENEQIEEDARNMGRGKGTKKGLLRLMWHSTGDSDAWYNIRRPNQFVLFLLESCLTAEVRVRFAPSPTGQPHIGNIRTALFNWLFARHHGGRFIVRVEDTDQARLVPGALESMLDGLRWLNIDWDEGPEVDGPYGPYLQSLRLEVYHGLAWRLVEQGNAYHCYCSREKLEQARRERPNAGGNLCDCRYISPDERAARKASSSEPGVIRFAMPTEGVTTVNDLVRGVVEWRNELLEDFIILKSDGFPTYHLAVVADDHLMRISHVMRAEEWLPSTPRHLQLYDALGFEPPEFAHLPMIMGPDRAKLSKRHGATAIGEYEEQGFLPEALINFMVLLGWSLDGSTDVIPLQTIIDNFTLDRITKSAAIFDQDKLMWMNGVYIREMASRELAERMAPFLERDLPEDSTPVDREYLQRIAPLVQERLKRLDDSAGLTAIFFGEYEDYEPATLVQKGMDRESALTALQTAIEDLEATEDFSHQCLEEILGGTGQRLELSRRQFFGLLRTAATGRTVSPPLFETMEVLGKELVMSRFKRAVIRLEGKLPLAGEVVIEVTRGQ